MVFDMFEPGSIRYLGTFGHVHDVRIFGASELRVIAGG